MSDDVQRAMLDNSVKTQSPVIVFLINGFQVKGIIRASDDYSILLDEAGKQLLIYKHAVSTIVHGTSPVLPAE